MRYLIGIDLGTSGTKTVLFDQSGKAIASASAEYPMHQPQNGWSEQEPLDWWNACVSTLQSVIKASDINPKDIAGVGISGQMHGLVMLDKNGEVLRRCIIWNDGRTVRECAEITEIVGAERLIEITANPALTGFTAGKILWVRRNEPELYAQCRHILLPKDFLRYKLTGEYATEVSDASGMNLLDVPKRKWSDEVLTKLNIDPSMLPPVRESYEIAGCITKEAATLTGLAEGTPVVGGAGDNAAAAIGTGTIRAGKMFCTVGTSAVIFAHSDNVAIDPAGRVHSFCSAVPGAWAVMSCTLSAGLSLQWLRNHFFTEEIQAAKGLYKDVYDIMCTQAEKVPIGANKLIFLPYLMGERSPLLDPYSRGVFFGLSATHSKYDMLRAVLEGVIYSQKHCLEVLGGMKLVPGEILATGGGGSSPLWRQMMADLFECPIVTTTNREGPALGAAILAGVGAGIYPNVHKACDNIIKTNASQYPIAENITKYAPYYKIYRNLYPALKDNFTALSATT